MRGRGVSWMAGVLVTASILGACAGRDKGPNAGLEAMTGRAKARPATRPPVRTPTPQDPADRAALAEMIRQQAIDTQKILDSHPAAPSAPPPPAARAAADSQPTVGDAGPKVTTASAPGSTGSAIPDRQPAAAPGATSAVASLSATAAPSVSIDEQVREAAGHLGDLLQEQTATDPSLRSHAAIAALDALRLRPAPSAPPTDSLTPGQRQVLEGLRDAVKAMAAGAIGGESDPERLAEQLRALADRLSGGRGLSISDLRLCTRVRGFGQFTTFPQSGAGPDAAVRLIAGGAHRALVYVELDRFAHRAADPADPELAAARERGEQWVVDLSQEINLFSEHGNLLVHRRPPERVVETSRSRRRDFYLVTEIALPGTLGAGVYHLKVTVRDRASGAVAERSLPIELMADTALISSGLR